MHPKRQGAGCTRTEKEARHERTTTPVRSRKASSPSRLRDSGVDVPKTLCFSFAYLTHFSTADLDPSTRPP